MEGGERGGSSPMNKRPRAGIGVACGTDMGVSLHGNSHKLVTWAFMLLVWSARLTLEILLVFVDVKDVLKIKRLLGFVE